MKHLITLLLILCAVASFGQSWTTGYTRPTGTVILQSPYNPTFYIFKQDTTVYLRAGSMGDIKLANAKHFQHKIDSLAYHGWIQVKDTLAFYRLKSDHDSLSTLQERSYNSLTDKPSLNFEPANANIQQHIDDDQDTSPVNEYNAEMGWNNSTNTIYVTDMVGTVSTQITGFLEAEVDGIINNEGSLTVQAGTPFNSIIHSNTSGSQDISIMVGSNLTIQEEGNTILISSTDSGTNSGDDAENTTSNAYADAKVEDQIVNGITNKAPSQNAVYDALDTKIDKTAMGQPNGVATIGFTGKIPSSQIPSLAISETFVGVNAEDRVLQTGAEVGDVYIATGVNRSYILQTEPYTTLNNWQLIRTPDSPVQSVNGYVGNVELTTSDITEGANKYYTEERVSANTNVVNATNHIANDLDTDPNNEIQDLSGLAPASGSANYIQASPASPQSANIDISGTTKIGGVTNILGGSSLGLTFRGNGIYTEEYDGTDGITVNYRGYNNGISQFRNFSVFNGKQDPVLVVTGNPKEIYAYGFFNTSTGYKLNNYDLFGYLSANCLPVWDGTKFVNSGWYKNGDNYGLGTTDPQDKLFTIGNIGVDWGGYIGFYRRYGTNTFNYNGVTIPSFGLAAGVASGDGDASTFVSGFKDIRLFTGNTEKVSLIQSGNFGIGYSTGTEIDNHRLAVNGSGYFNGNVTVIVPHTGGINAVGSAINWDVNYKINGKQSVGTFPGWDAGILYINGTSDWTNGTHIKGSLLQIDGDTKVLSTTASTSTSTGALTVAGGIGVEKNIYLAGHIGLGNASTSYLKANYNGELLAGVDASGFYFANGFGIANTLPIFIGSPTNTVRVQSLASGSSKIVIAESNGTLGTTAIKTNLSEFNNDLGLGASAFHADDYFARLHGSISEYFNANSININSGILMGASLNKRIELIGDTYYFGNTDGTLNMTYNTATGTLTAPNIAGMQANTDEQTLSAGTKTGVTQPISISNGNTINIDVSDNDNNPSNELQTISKVGSTVTLSNGGGAFTDTDTDTDQQQLSLVGNSLSITNGNSVTLPAEVDGSVTNEIQNLSYNVSTRVLSIDGTGSTDVTLPVYSSSGPGLMTSVEYGLLGKVYLGGYGPYVMSFNYFDVDGFSSIVPRFGSVAEDEYLPVTGNDVWLNTVNKQDLLLSGTNIKTINGQSILGSGNLTVSGGTTDHAALSNLSYANSGHTGFAAINGSISQSFSVNDLSIEGGANDWSIYDSGSDLYFSQYTGSIHFNYSTGVHAPDFTRTSDIRKKQNIKDLDSLDWLNGIKYIQYTMKNDSTNRIKYGVSAQQVETIAPQLVYTDEKGEKSVAYIDLLVAEIVNMKKEINDLKARINTLENEK